MIYFDNAATSFPKPEEVYKKMDFVNRHLAVNAGRGEYNLALEADAEIGETRKKIARLMGVQSEKVFFTPSNTMAMNVIIQGLDWDRFKTVYVTPFEHNAVMRVLEVLRQNFSFAIKILPFCSKTYLPDFERIDREFAIDKPDYIFINHASNVIGKIVPVEELLKIAKPYNPIVIVDVAQTIGVVDVGRVAKQVDFTVFAGHKGLYGPLGVGGFVDNSKITLKTVFAGGTGSDSRNLSMPKYGALKFEIGSPNIVAISGLGAGADFIELHGLQNIVEHKVSLMRYFLNGIKGIPKIKVFELEESDYALGLVSFVVEGYESSDVGQILNDEYDIAVRTGFHCAPIIHDLIDSLEYGGTVRVSFGYFNTKSEIDVLLDALRSL